MTSKSRINELDILKGIAILLMILDHALAGDRKFIFIKLFSRFTCRCSSSWADTYGKPMM